MLIANGKSEYRFIVKDTQEAEKAIQAWLSANDFQRMQENGAIVYRSGEPVIQGYRFFEYVFSESEIIVYAYLGSYRKPKALAKGMAGAMAIIPYKNLLGSLFAVLDAMAMKGDQKVLKAREENTMQDQQNNMNGNYPQGQQYNNTPQGPQNNMNGGYAQGEPYPQGPQYNNYPQGPYPQGPQNSPYNNFQQEASNRYSTYAEVTFWISIIMLVLSIIGFAIGILPSVANLVFAIQGLKSYKRGKAIAAVVMTSIAIVLSLVYISLVVLGILEFEYF